ncbi:MAG: HTH-type transcriptional regulator Xre [Firmicutes bacterium ADurb.Bin419]|nr:MAG: HTH-type transcriptional regulator Xre [Firmicutes bacterium ADurb.Bin419]
MNETFSERLKEIRKSKGLTQRQFAAAIGCNRATYNHYENGNRHPDVVMIKEICQKFNVSADYLLGLSATKNVPLSLPANVTGFSEQALEYLLRKKHNCDFATNEPGLVNKVLDFIILDADFSCIFDQVNPNPFIAELQSTGMLPPVRPDQIKDKCSIHILDAIKSDWNEDTFATAESDSSLKEEEEIIASLGGESALYVGGDNNPTDCISIQEMEDDGLLGIDEKDFIDKQASFLHKEAGKSLFLDILMEYLMFDKYDVSLCSTAGYSELSENRNITIRLGNTSIRFPSEESSQLIETMLLQNVMDSLKKLKQNFKGQSD